MNAEASEQKIKFPISYDLKVIMERKLTDDEHKGMLRSILEDLSIPHADWSHKYSKELKYISITVHITLDKKERMDILYERLRTDSHVRVAI